MTEPCQQQTLLKTRWNIVMLKEKQVKENAVHVMVVEDDIHIGRLIGLTMPALGIPYRFTNVLSGAQAVEVWRKDPFGILLTDYNLPGMNGLQLIDELQKDNMRIPIIMFTAYATPQLEREARKRGISAFLNKPFAMDELIDVMRSLLTKKTKAIPTKH
jgi:two-component system, OmpR family, response regulator